MIDALEFEDASRTFTCKRETTRGTDHVTWWWFTVSGDGHRYAPFRATELDTVASVRERVVAYYTSHQTRRANPAAGRTGWWNRRSEAPRTDGAPAVG